MVIVYCLALLLSLAASYRSINFLDSTDAQKLNYKGLRVRALITRLETGGEEVKRISLKISRIANVKNQNANNVEGDVKNSM